MMFGMAQACQKVSAEDLGNEGSGLQAATAVRGFDPGTELELVLRCQVPGQLFASARKHDFFSLR